jgi:hypothetical protein
VLESLLAYLMSYGEKLPCTDQEIAGQYPLVYISSSQGHQPVQWFPQIRWLEAERILYNHGRIAGHMLDGIKLPCDFYEK